MKAAPSLYIQLANQLCERILNGEYLPGSRIPSVRIMSSEMELNPNTVMKAFWQLQQRGILFNETNVGYFVSPGAVDRILRMKRENLVKVTLPSLFKDMVFLNVSLEDLNQAYTSYMSNLKNDKAE